MNQNWTELLHFLYVNDTNWQYFSKAGSPIDATHPIVEETDLSVADAQSALSFLERQGLIEDGGSGQIQLTEKGFNVARDEEYRRTQVKSNNRVYLLTFVLAGTAVLDTLSIFTLPDGVKETVAIFFITFLVLMWLSPGIRQYTGFEPDRSRID